MPETETTEVETPEAPEAPETPQAPEPPKDELGDAGKRALEAERSARKAAEKKARDAEKKLADIDAQNLTETEKLKKAADDGTARAAMATERLQRANLLSALSDEGLTGKQAKAAARLLDDVQFDDDDEPTNLADALTAAKALFGDSMFTPAATADPKTPLPDLHAGARTDQSAKPDSTGWFPQLNKKT